MGQGRHYISEVDESSRRGVCSVCGPVPVYEAPEYKGKRYWRCGSKQQADASASYRKNHRRVRGNRFRSRYGITLDDYNEMLERQGGTCARCKQPPGLLRLAVDHDHYTGRVRGLLCGACNTYLGRLEANRDRLGDDLRYLGAVPIAEMML
jgi:hypothetical protein